MGLPVLALVPGCHAERAGICVGDEVVKIDDQIIDSIDDYVQATTDAQVNNKLTVMVEVKRDGKLLVFEMIAGRPAPVGLN